MAQRRPAAVVVLDRAFCSLAAVAARSFGAGAERALTAIGWAATNVRTAAQRRAIPPNHELLVLSQ